MEKKESKYVLVVAKVTPSTKKLIEDMAAQQVRTISQQIRSTLEEIYGK